ncbi:cyclopropane fatty acyl phospholipid synthase [Sorangium sp. So ce1099]|uniref:cyclopropane fatty acyl phospholipid synthase n=1 Tax=Sorangium sp. So ce1099 TaxID=3133331 RepID=UPI003F632BB3
MWFSDTAVPSGAFIRPEKVRARAVVEALARRAGVAIGGSGPLSVRVVDDDVYEIALSRGFTGLRDAYVDGAWEAERLDVITERLLSQRVPLRWADRAELAIGALSGRLLNLQSRARSAQAGRHYDLGNDLYRAMLDRSMVYSCAYWRGARTLDEAQEAKLDLVCRKLGLAPGMRVLDIGCGWGSFARFAAERHGVSVVGITISREQAQLGAELCAGLPVSIRVEDYRQLDATTERFDRIVSLGMLEHVGYKNYRRYLSIARRKLADDGLFLLHTIGGNVSKTSYDAWMNDNVFPNALLPSAAQLAAACEGLMVIEDWHNFGADYDRTLMCWFENFDRSWPRLRARYGERFYRMWKCYLLTCAGAFRARAVQLWQLVLSPSGVRGGYHAPR